MSRPIIAHIDTGALRHNLGVIRRQAPHSRIMAVVKANAYGHGLPPAISALADADALAVASVEEALQVRERGWRKPVLLLEGIFSADELLLCRQHHLSMVVHQTEQIHMLEQGGSEPLPPVFVKLNSGMNRLGFTPADFSFALNRLRGIAAIDDINLISHFACADEPAGIADQMTVINASFAGLNHPRSLANSAAIFRYSQTHADWVRPGIALYGASPFSEHTGEQLGLLPVMTVSSRVIAIQHLNIGQALGYANTWFASRPSRVAVIACGYADGYPRHANTGSPILIDGHLTRTLGRVSMDMLFADLTELPASIGIGADVTLWGKNMPVERLAQSAQTISYELLCARAPRVNATVLP